MKSASLKLYTRRGQIYGSDRIKLLSQMRQGWNRIKMSRQSLDIADQLGSFSKDYVENISIYCV